VNGVSYRGANWKRPGQAVAGALLAPSTLAGKLTFPSCKLTFLSSKLDISQF
jgi:hypothetical protein